MDAKTALVIIDLQKGIVSYPTAHPIGEVVRQAGELAAAFRRHHLPVVLVNVAGGAPGRTQQPAAVAEPPADWTELVPALNRQPQDHVVTKRTWGAFTNTNLEAHLQRLGVTQIVLAGVATSIGVESTARHAHELGFHVALAVDAMTDLSLDAHNHSVTRIFPRLGENGTTHEILELLKKRLE
ncbi:MAG TPA: isochorismatase family protein [Steroidobacteraceae bacterium]|nr:isochorismatase family protein [Steroidobacteraceae bacterium]